MTSCLVGWKDPSRARASVGKPGAEQKGLLEEGDRDRERNGDWCVHQVHPRRGRGVCRGGALDFSFTLWLPNMDDALPRQEPDHEEEESEGSCICREKSQWTSLTSVGTPVRHMHPQNWGYR